MDEKLLQILDNSACLSKGQLTGYIKHTLYPEELRAVELHLSSCSLCNDALEGMEMQQDVDSLIASMVPPVLPVIAAKEKPKEKKEIPVAAKTEKTETSSNHVKPVAVAKHEATHKNDTQQLAFRPGKSWSGPVGIAAALVLSFAGFWYFGFNRDNSKKQIAQQRETTSDTAPAYDMANQPAVQSTTPGPDSMAKLVEKKRTDSIYLVKREEQRLKAKKDSLLAVNIKKDSGKSLASESPAVAASRMAMADQANEAEVAKKPAAAPPKAKEETKKEPSDYELGMRKYKEKNYASALLYFKSAENDKSDPKHWDAVYYSGLCNRNLNKERKARKLFERVVEAGAPQKKSAQKQLDDMKKDDK